MQFYPAKCSEVPQKTAYLVSKPAISFVHPRRKKLVVFVNNFANSYQNKIKVLFLLHLL